MRVEVKPRMLKWARERSGLDEADLRARFPRLGDWEHGTVHPTMKQLETFARATYAPLGFFFLEHPPTEQVPISDFRTFAGHEPTRPSPALLDTIYLCQERQGWYRDFVAALDEPNHPFVGSAKPTDDVVKAAAAIRRAIGFDLASQRHCKSMDDALRRMVESIDDAGVLVMVAGIVGNDTHRPLDAEEFRGFALVDPVAPLIFVNGADTKAAQMFTLAHELAHVWLGTSGVSDADAATHAGNRTEDWCNRTAAELLVPLSALRNEHRPEAALAAEMKRLATSFKVSTLVILRRLLDIDALTQQAFAQAYADEVARLRALMKGAGGGDFYRSQAARLGKRFARAVITSTLEGQTMYRDAFRLLGVSKVETFNRFGDTLGMA